MLVKIHTPKSLKTGVTLKQFLLSLLATTISIILTFGTAAWVDNRKKNEAKLEIVKMILYDIAGSIEQIQKTDSILREGFEQQVAVAAQPELLIKNPYVFHNFFPQITFSETVERIFSSNIETINVIENVNFADEVSRLYLLRKKYLEDIYEDYQNEYKEKNGFKEYSQAMGIDFSMYICIGGMYLNEMKKRFELCKQMMGVSDAELESYRQKRFDMVHPMSFDSIDNALTREMMQNLKRLDEAKEKGK